MEGKASIERNELTRKRVKQETEKRKKRGTSKRWLIKHLASVNEENLIG